MIVTVSAISRMVFVMALAALALCAGAAHAATPISKDEANAYYAKCVATPDERMSAQTKTDFCACTSAYMMQTMSAEDIKLMSEKTPAGRIMLSKMMVVVHGPCISAPISDLVTNQCPADPRVMLADETQDPVAICSCMAAKTDEWLEQNGPDVITRVLEENPYIVDSIGTVMQSEVYKREEYEILMDCLQAPTSIKRQYRAKPAP